VVFTADDVIAGQQVFLKHGLMDSGTTWGHGGYLGPDFSAQTLHILALDLADRIARERLSHGYTDLTTRRTPQSTAPSPST
jgi:nitric oxide reductase subunit B